MRIKKIISQYRRDFTAIYECEHCGHEYEGRGYDDTYFHQVVLPLKTCPECHETAREDYVPRTPKYPDGVQV